MKTALILVVGSSLIGCLSSTPGRIAGESVDDGHADTTTSSSDAASSDATADTIVGPQDAKNDASDPMGFINCYDQLEWPLDDPICWGWEEIGPIHAASSAVALCADGEDGGRALGSSGHLWIWDTDGFELEVVALPPLVSFTDLWCGSSTLWATADDGSVWRRTEDGAWSAEVVAERVRLTGVAGTTDGEPWVVGEDGIVAHRDAAGWSTTRLPGEPTLDDVAIVGGAALVAGGFAPEGGGAWSAAVYRDAGDGWQRIYDGDGRARRLWASGPSDVWIGGDGPNSSVLLSHFDGVSWQPEAAPSDGYGAQALAGWDDELWIATPKLHHRVDGTWSQPTTTDGTPIGSVGAIAPTGPGRAWAASGGHIFEIGPDGVSGFGGGSRYVYGVDGSGPDDVWIVGQRGLVAHFDGRAWRFEDRQPGELAYSTTVTWSGDLRDAWLAPSGALWVVGEGGVVWWRGPDGVWSRRDAPTTGRLTSVWGWDDDQLWVTATVGDEEWEDNDGLLFAWDGASWEAVPGPVGGLRALAGTPGVDAWAVGRGDAVYRYDGAQWTTIALPVVANLGDLWAVGPGHVVAGGAPDAFEGDYTGLIVEITDGAVSVTKTSANEQILALWADAGFGIAIDARSRLWVRGPEGWVERANLALLVPIVGASRLWCDGQRLWLYGADGSVKRSAPLTDLRAALGLSGP